MGIPYSKQIDIAFDQVGPLVAAGIDVLHTTKNISISLAVIQVLTVLVLVLILLALLAILVTVNPDLDAERQALVTPGLKWMAQWIVQYGKLLFVSGCVVTVGFAIGTGGGWYITRGDASPATGEAPAGDKDAE